MGSEMCIRDSSNHFFEVTNPAAKEMMEWRDQCDSSIRVATQILSRGTPKLGDELAEVSQAVLLGKLAPLAAAQQLEQGLKGWYGPHQGKVKGADCQCEVPADPSTAVSGASASLAPSAAVSSMSTPAAALLPAAGVEEALASELATPTQ